MYYRRFILVVNICWTPGGSQSMAILGSGTIQHTQYYEHKGDRVIDMHHTTVRGLKKNYRDDYFYNVITRLLDIKKLQFGSVSLNFLHPKSYEQRKQQRSALMAFCDEIHQWLVVSTAKGQLCERFHALTSIK